jgi:uncharacterized membrane protein
MAGIGFELKKLFSQKGLLLKLRANTFASIVVAGPMVLGFLLLLGAKLISVRFGATGHEQDLIMVIITYSLLFSLLLDSTIMYTLARYIADSLYTSDYNRILPSMYGSITLLLIIGSIGWSIFLYISKLPLIYSFLSFTLFCEGVVIWIQVNYVTAIKDYKKIMLGFLIGIMIGLLVGFGFAYFGYDIVASMLIAAVLAYGIMILYFTQVLHQYFPKGVGTSFRFLEWIERYPSLSFIGFFTTLGLFIHLMLMWRSPWGIQVHGLFYHAPPHDIAALFAFVTSLPSAINFVTSVEVSVYPKYRLYFTLLNGEGSLSDIRKSEKELLTVLKEELFYLAIRQVLVTLFAVIVIGEVLPYLQLGYTSIMIGLFRVLSVGYGLYAIGNSLMLFLLYFSNYGSALKASFMFVVINTLGTLYTISQPEVYYGFGFVLSGIAFYIVSLFYLAVHTKHIDHFIFSNQPIFFYEKQGILKKIVQRLETKS